MCLPVAVQAPKKKKIKIGTLSFQHEEAAEHDLEVFHFEFKSLK